MYKLQLALQVTCKIFQINDTESKLEEFKHNDAISLGTWSLMFTEELRQLCLPKMLSKEKLNSTLE